MNLRPVPQTKRELVKDGEVEARVNAIGMNFRDVLNTWASTPARGRGTMHGRSDFGILLLQGLVVPLLLVLLPALMGKGACLRPSCKRWQSTPHSRSCQ
jgi:hypothetical protein